MSQELQLIDTAIKNLPDAATALMNSRSILALAEAKITKFVESLPDGIQTPEKDAEIAQFLARFDVRFKEVKEREDLYVPYLDIIKKEFLKPRNALDKKHNTFIGAPLVKLRNDFAAVQYAKEQARLKAIQDKENKAKEEIELKACISTAFNKYFTDYVATKKATITKAFDNINYCNYAEKAEGLKGLKFAYDFNHFQTFQFSATGNYHTLQDIAAFAIEATNGKYDDLNLEYIKQMCELQSNLVLQLPAKYEELCAIELRRIEAEEAEKERLRLEAEKAKANAEDRAKIEAQQKENARIEAERKAASEKEEAERKQREAEAQAKIEADRLATQKAAEEKAAAEKLIANTQTMFDSHAEIAEIALPLPKIAKKIELVDATGIVPMFSGWYEAVGAKMTTAELTKKFDFIFSHFNKQAKDEIFIEHQGIKYVNEIKAATLKTGKV